MSGPGRAAWPLGAGVVVVAEQGTGLVGLAKPAGVLSHPNQRGDEPRSLLQAAYDPATQAYMWDAAGNQRGECWLLNRLDSATSGVILGATTRELAEVVRAEFLRKRVRKVYVALVFGVPPKPRDVWKDLLAVEKSGGQIRTQARAGHIPAECRVEVLAGTTAGGVPLALLRLEPLTGRSHQLRVQCARRHLPIVGDQTYGDFARNRQFARTTGGKRLFLHSLESEFSYEFRGRRHEFRAHAPLPPEFAVTARAAGKPARPRVP